VTGKTPCDAQNCSEREQVVAKPDDQGIAFIGGIEIRMNPKTPPVSPSSVAACHIQA